MNPRGPEEMTALVELLRAPSEERVRVGSWQEVYDLARRNSVAPLLYRRLRAREQGAPEELLSVLKRDYHQALARNILLLHELERLAARFAAAGLRVAVLKGAALLCTERVPVDQRPTTDLDLWVCPEDAPAARDLLVQDGYKPQPDFAEGFTEAFLGERAYYKGGERRLVADLHWHLLNHQGQRAWERDAWARLRPIAFGQTGAWALSPEDELLHMALHLIGHHGGEGLLWRHDLALLTAEGQDLDWDQILADARRLRAAGSLRLALELAAPLGAKVPPEVTESLAREPIAARERVFLTLVTDPRFRRSALNLKSWLVLKGWRARWVFLRCKLSPQEAFAPQAEASGKPLTRWEPVRRAGQAAAFFLLASGRILRALLSRRLPQL